jgi:hypothetical protein
LPFDSTQHGATRRLQAPATPVSRGFHSSDGNLPLNGLYSFNAFGREDIRTYVGLGIAWLIEVDIDFEQGGQQLSYSGDHRRAVARRAACAPITSRGRRRSVSARRFAGTSEPA